MKKQFTTKEIAEALQEFSSMEFMVGRTGDGIYYFIHLDLDSLELVSSQGWNIESFNTEYHGLIDEEDDSYGWENMKNKDFVDVAEELRNQVNEFIENL